MSADTKTPLPNITQKLAVTGISHYMTRNAIYATPTTTIRLAMQMMLNHKISGLPIVDDTMSVLGVYSEVDAMLQAASQDLDAIIKFTKPAKLIKANTVFRDALVLMVKERLKRIPVVDEHRKLVGILTRRDLMKAYIQE
jgi:CBS domain-containing protein